MKTVAELNAWIVGAAQQFGDPAIPVGQMFVRFQHTIGHANTDLIATYEHGLLLINLRVIFSEVLPLELNVDGPQFDDSGLTAFGIEKVSDGLWHLTPSLNLPDLVHAFVVVYDVPSPAPWEPRGVLLG